MTKDEEYTNLETLNDELVCLKRKLTTMLISGCNESINKIRKY